MPLEKRRPNPPQRFDPFSAERRRSPELPPRARPIRATSALRGGKKHVSVSYVTCFFARSHAQIHVGKKKVAYLCSSFLSFTAPSRHLPASRGRLPTSTANGGTRPNARPTRCMINWLERQTQSGHNNTSRLFPLIPIPRRSRGQILCWAEELEP